MDRVAACKHAIEKAKLKLQAAGLGTGNARLSAIAAKSNADGNESLNLIESGATAHANTMIVTAASDAFFPFDDGPRLLIDAGVQCIVHPGGSKRDGDTQALCNERGVTLLVTGTRHFKH